jgi:hypothetical protein
MGSKATKRKWSALRERNGRGTNLQLFVRLSPKGCFDRAGVRVAGISLVWEVGSAFVQIQLRVRLSCLGYQRGAEATREEGGMKRFWREFKIERRGRIIKLGMPMIIYLTKENSALPSSPPFKCTGLPTTCLKVLGGCAPWTKDMLPSFSLAQLDQGFVSVQPLFFCLLYYILLFSVPTIEYLNRLATVLVCVGVDQKCSRCAMGALFPYFVQYGTAVAPPDP